MTVKPFDSSQPVMVSRSSCARPYFSPCSAASIQWRKLGEDLSVSVSMNCSNSFSNCGCALQLKQHVRHGEVVRYQAAIVLASWPRDACCRAA